MVVKATKTKSWAEAMEKNNWTPALLPATSSRSSSTTSSRSLRRGDASSRGMV